MRIDGFVPAHRPDDAELPERIVEMIVAAHDVRHAHVVIVHHDSEHVGGRAVRPEQDHVVQFGVLDGHVALDPVMDRRGARRVGAQPDDERRADGRFGRVAVPPAAVVAQR
jgi:hypothetical protein